MFFLNLSAGEFLALLGGLGGIVTALYLLDRTKRKRVVSTLRFWTSAGVAEDQPRRRKVNQPWSLLLQLLSLLCLLLAIAQLNWGTREFRSRDHVLLLDTSAWAGEQTRGVKTIDRERETAQSYIAGLRPGDRILLVGVDALSTPLTAFTSDHTQLRAALANLKEGFSALNIGGALSYARQAQQWSGGTPGEIVYVGPACIDAEKDSPAPPSNLRLITLPSDGQNSGIRSVAVRRMEDDPNAWRASINLKNDGSAPHNVVLRTQFAGTKFAPRNYALKPGAEMDAQYDFVTNTAGLLSVEIEPHDALPIDDRATLQLPANGALRVAVYTRRKALLNPLLAADHRLEVEYLDPDQYQTKKKADALILDGFCPKIIPSVPALYINPPKQTSPLPVKATVNQVPITNWQTGTELDSGLHTREERLPTAQVFQLAAGDVPFASLAAGPTIVLRPHTSEGSKLALIGFDPLQPQLRFTLTTPLVFANLLSWLSPESFRILDFTAKRVGSASLPLNEAEASEKLSVVNARGLALPFTLAENNLQVFAGQPEVVRVVSEDRERVLSLTLPDVARDQWKPSKVATGIPLAATYLPTATDLWKFLACLAGLGLLAEWYLFGGGRRPKVIKARTARPSFDASNTPTKEELVSR